MSRSMVTTGPTTTTPVWCNDFRSRDHLIPGGGKLDAAAFAANGAGLKFVPSGTLIGRTHAERLAGSGYGPAAAGDEDVKLVAFDVDDAAHINDVELLRPGAAVKENRLPGFGGMSAAVLALLRANYHCVTGAE